MKPDLYFVLRLSIDGKKMQEALGWASEGMPLEKAWIELAKLKEAKRTGQGAKTLRLLSEHKHSKITHDMAIFGLDCGLRTSEIVSLCWEDCDFEGGRMPEEITHLIGIRHHLVTEIFR